MRSQPRGDCTRIAAVRVPSLLDDAFLALHGRYVSAVTPDSGPTDHLGFDPEKSIIPDRSRDRLGWPSFAAYRRLVYVLLSLVPRRTLVGG